MSKPVPVLDYNWDEVCKVERPIAREMVEAGGHAWVHGCRAVRSRTPTEFRPSDPSPGALTSADAELLANGVAYMTARQKERLAGHGFSEFAQ